MSHNPLFIFVKNAQVTTLATLDYAVTNPQSTAITKTIEFIDPYVTDHVCLSYTMKFLYKFFSIQMVGTHYTNVYINPDSQYST